MVEKNAQTSANWTVAIESLHNVSVVGEPDNVILERFRWDSRPGGNVEHLARHQITIDDVDAVRVSNPLIYRNAEGHRATHAMIGKDARGRSLIVYIAPTDQAGIWQPVTGWRSSIAHQLLEKEGRI